MFSILHSWIEQDSSGDYCVMGETNRDWAVANEVLAHCGKSEYVAGIMLDLTRGIVSPDLSVGKSANYTYDFRVQCVGSVTIRDAEIIAFFLRKMGRCVIMDITQECVTRYSLLHMPGVSPLTMHGTKDQWYWMTLDEPLDVAPYTAVAAQDTSGDVLLLTGDTYELRAKIRTQFMPIKYDKLRGGWLIPLQQRAALDTFAAEYDLTVECVSYEMDSETKRDALQAARETKLERLYKRLGRLQTAYDKIRGAYKSFTSDNAFLTQPILTGHHSESGHRTLKAKISANEDRKHQFYFDIEKVTQQIADLENPKTLHVKGDAQRRDAAKIERLDLLLSVGSRVHSFLYGLGTIIKVNKVSYQVQWDKGFTNKTEKVLCDTVG